MKRLLSFISRWSDILVFIPVFLILFIFNGVLIRSVDETAGIVNIEFLSILNFNLLVYGVVMSSAYFIYNLFFYDFFKKGWEEKVGQAKAGIIHLILWGSTLAASYSIITHNL